MPRSGWRSSSSSRASRAARPASADRCFVPAPSSTTSSACVRMPAICPNWVAQIDATASLWSRFVAALDPAIRQPHRIGRCARYSTRENACCATPTFPGQALRAPRALRLGQRSRVPPVRRERGSFPAIRGARNDRSLQLFPNDDAPATEPALRLMPMPADLNSAGDVFGGWVMAMVAHRRRSARDPPRTSHVVTMAVNSLRLRQPISVGDVVNFVRRRGRGGQVLDHGRCACVRRASSRRSGGGQR